MRFLALALAVILWATSAIAQQPSQFPTGNNSIKVTTGLTYQAVVAAGQSLRSLTIQNNNTNGDNCFIGIGTTIAAGNTTGTSVTINGVAMTAAQASVVLSQGQSYTRYYPYIPSGPIVATCTTNGDSLYVDWQ